MESTGTVHGFLHFPLGTKTGPALLRGAKIDCIETFVPFGGPDPILLMPTRKDAAKPPQDPKIAAVEEGWDGSMVPDKSISALLKKPVYASATDCVNPETLKTAYEARERTRLYNEMLDQKRAESERWRIQREEQMQKQNLRKIQKLKEAEERRLAEIERGKRKQIALQEEIEGDIEDRQLMLDKIQREHAALYNSTQPLPTMYGRRISFARSIGYITRDVSGCNNCDSLTCSDKNCGKPIMARNSPLARNSSGR